MKNDLSWLDELPDYGAATPPEKNPVFFNVEGHTHHGYGYQPEINHLTPEQRREVLNAFLLSVRYNDAAVHEQLKQYPELEALSANVRRQDALNARAIQGQTVLRYAFPELGPEPGAYFLKRNKPLPECQTRTEAYAAVYDDYMAEVMAEYKVQQERKKKQEQIRQKEEAKINAIQQIEQARQAEQIAQEAKQQKIQQCAIIGAITLPIIILIYLKRKYIWKKIIAPLLRPFPLIICILLALALCQLSYGYYQFLRIAVTIWGIISIIQTSNRPDETSGKTCTMLLSGGIAILYNPILPIHLDKEAWIIINLVSIPCVLLSTYLTHRTK